MRDLRRRNSNTLAVHELKNAGVEAFTPMTQMIMTIGGRRQRREVPVVQDLLFVHEAKPTLDIWVARIPMLQYRYVLGRPQSEPMTVREADMERFIRAVGSTDAPLYYTPGELTASMYGRPVRIVGGTLDGYQGRLLSVRGMRRRRLLVELPGLVSAAVEVEPEYIRLLK